MKKLLLLAGVFAAMFITASCDPSDDPDNGGRDGLEVTAENLKGTWEGGVEHDFAQGYPQNWRIQIDGENYTTWHTHQTAGSTMDEVQGLKTVGNKEKGTWAFDSGVLILTPKEQFASYVQIMKPDYTLGGYVYYDYNEVTMEAVQWYETSSYFIEEGVKRDLEEGTDWYVKKWNILKLTKDELTVKINRDTFVLKKK
jgi:hypothetical protein